MRLLRSTLTIATVVALVVLEIAGTSAAQAPTTWHVNSTVDAVGTCTISPKYCTLRSAIGAAQHGDKIVIAAGVYHLTINSSLNVNDLLTIVGAGSAKTQIVGNTAGQTSFTQSVFTFGSQANATLKGLTISGGKQAANGGGIANSSGGTLTLISDVISDNVAAGEGGGIANEGGSLLTITNSKVTSNQAPNGGGIENASGATLKMDKTTVSGNTSGATGAGGGLLNDATATVTSSTISDNTGGTAPGDGGGGIFGSGGDLTMRSSTVSGNTGATGGGIFLQLGTANITNSTLSGNKATSGTGGGIIEVGTNVSLTSVTIAQNSSSVEGGGLYVSGGTVFLTASILGENTGPDPDCWGAPVSHNFNVIQTVNVDCNPTPGPKDSFGVGDPNLGALTYGGGLTETHAIPRSSLAAGRDATDPTCNGHTKDQRGMVRPAHKCDSGAFQVTR